MSSTPWTVDAGPAPGPAGAPPGVPAGRPLPPPGARWGGWPEVRADLRTAVRVALLVGLAGLPAGLLWWQLAPRVTFVVTDAGPEPLGDFSEEFRIADDAVLALILLGVGLLAGLATWFLSRRRGVAAVLALAVGGLLAGLIAWQLGEALGAGPSESQALDPGTRLTTGLQLGSLTVLAAAPFTALLGYLAATLGAPDDGLGRPPLSSPSSASRTDAAAPAPPPGSGAS
jgi:hypothetical protein